MWHLQTLRGGEWYLKKRESRKILAGSRNLGNVFDKSRSLVFSWFVFTFFDSRNFSPKSLGLGFLTRISASRRVSDFTIRHPYFTSGNSFPAYFDLKCEPGTAWTLVMSWSVGYLWPPPFTKFPFKYNSPVNENAQNWNLYRLSLVRMRSLQGHSTHWRATCSYTTYGIDFRDYLRRKFKDFNIVDFLGDRQCKKVEYINTRGHVGTHLKVPFWQRLNS